MVFLFGWFCCGTITAQTTRRKSIMQSEENLRLNNDYYRAGTTTMSDLLDAQSSYQQSRDKYVDAYIGYQQNLLKYRQTTGQ